MGKKLNKIEHEYLTDWFTEDAINFISQRQKAEKPWFLYLSYNCPHGPVYGEVHADHLADAVTSDWEAFIENSKGYQELYELVQISLKEKLYEKFTNEINLAKARLQQQIDRELARLPENRQEYARKAIDKVLEKFYSEADVKKGAIISVVIDALERDDYYAVLVKIDAARHAEIADFADALSEFGLVELSVIGRHAKRRLNFLQ